MTFKKHFDNIKPAIHAYIFDAPDDYIGVLLKQMPTMHKDEAPIVLRRFLGTYISARTQFLFYFLHKLHVRPENR